MRMSRRSGKVSSISPKSTSTHTISLYGNPPYSVLIKSYDNLKNSEPDVYWDITSFRPDVRGRLSKPMSAKVKWDYEDMQLATIIPTHKIIKIPRTLTIGKIDYHNIR